MADTADVENAFVSMICTSLLSTDYVVGTAESSLSGQALRVYRGWPLRRQLDLDLQADVTNISVFPRPEEVNTTRYDRGYVLVTPHQHTVTATIVGTTITFGGVVSAQNVALIINDHYYIHTLLLSESLTDLASALAALVSVDTTAVALGPTLALPLTRRLVVRVGGFGAYSSEMKRQQRTYQVTIWAATPALRDQLASAVDELLAAVQWLNLADGTTARIRYHNSLLDDTTQKVGLYRRDLFYSAEFGTTVALFAPEVVIAVADYTVLPDTAIVYEYIA